MSSSQQVTPSILLPSRRCLYNIEWLALKEGLDWSDSKQVRASIDVLKNYVLNSIVLNTTNDTRTKVWRVINELMRVRRQFIDNKTPEEDVSYRMVRNFLGLIMLPHHTKSNENKTPYVTDKPSKMRNDWETLTIEQQRTIVDKLRRQAKSNNEQLATEAKWFLTTVGEGL
jgi:hypothetical protein